MKEHWLCMNCLIFGPLDEHGRCSTCGSSALAPQLAVQFRGKTITDLEKNG